MTEAPHTPCDLGTPPPAPMMQPAILLWYYRDAPVVENRVRGLRLLNPTAPIFGLFGGPTSERRSFGEVRKLLDDDWCHPPVTPGWAWHNGDLMWASWFAARGQELNWNSVVICQWDLVMTKPVSTFAVASQTDIMLTGVRRIEEVSDHWVWVQPWSHHRPAFDHFRLHPMVAGRQMWASIFILATLTREFLRSFASVAPDVPGFIEYRLPTLAHAMGFQFVDMGVQPDWGDLGSELTNGSQREVTLEAIRAEMSRPAGARVFHPVYEMMPWHDLARWSTSDDR